jgi:hypothetical protein
MGGFFLVDVVVHHNRALGEHGNRAGMVARASAILCGCSPDKGNRNYAADPCWRI